MRSPGHAALSYAPLVYSLCPALCALHSVPCPALHSLSPLLPADWPPARARRPMSAARLPPRATLLCTIHCALHSALHRAPPPRESRVVGLGAAGSGVSGVGSSRSVFPPPAGVTARSAIYMGVCAVLLCLCLFLFGAECYYHCTNNAIHSVQRPGREASRVHRI